MHNKYHDSKEVTGALCAGLSILFFYIINSMKNTPHSIDIRHQKSEIRHQASDLDRYNLK